MADQSSRYISNLTRDTYALILAGGKGSRLHELTNWRAKPALYFGGKFRIIDFNGPINHYYQYIFLSIIYMARMFFVVAFEIELP